LNYLIILILIAVVVGPIFGLMPSSKQKRQMKLRDKAMGLGFQVKICQLPQLHRAKIRKEDTVEGVAYRFPRNTKNQAGRAVVSEQQILCLRDGTDQDKPKNPSPFYRCLEEALDVLPSDIVAVELTPLWYGVYWNERGSEEDILIIKSQLEMLDKRISQFDSL
jgi:hypothetical protein